MDSPLVFENPDICGIILPQLDWVSLLRFSKASKLLNDCNKDLKMEQNTFDPHSALLLKTLLHSLRDGTLTCFWKYKNSNFSDVIACSLGRDGVGYLTKSGGVFFAPERGDPEVYPFNSNDGKPVGIALGGDHSLEAFTCHILTNRGRVWSRNLKQSKWIQVPNLKSIIQIASGKFHHLALTINGEVYSWGKNEDGIKTNTKTEEDSIPTKLSLVNLQKDEKVILVVAGAYHNFLITDEGRAYSYGHGQQGQLAQNSDISIPIPTFIEGLRGHRIIGASCTYGSVTFLTAGWSTSGRLGLGKVVGDHKAPKEVIHSTKDIVSLQSGSIHTIMLSRSGSFTGWGETINNFFPTNENQPKNDYHLPSKLQVDLPFNSFFHWSGHDYFKLEPDE